MPDAPPPGTPCDDKTCELVAIITDDDGGVWCLLHAPTPEGYETPDPAEEITFDEDASLKLAAVLLMATADCLRNDGDQVPETVGTLAAATGMPLDVASGILLVTTLIAVNGELSPEVLDAAAAKYGTFGDDDVADEPETAEATAPAEESTQESEV
jgi:hypothetical protein